MLTFENSPVQGAAGITEKLVVCVANPGPRAYRKERLSNHTEPAFREGPARGLQLGRSALQRRWRYLGPCCRKTPCTLTAGCDYTLAKTDHPTS